MEGVSYGVWKENGREYIVIRTTVKKGDKYYSSDEWILKK